MSTTITEQQRSKRRRTATEAGVQPRAVIYSRISQDREGKRLGVEDQRKRCRDLARRVGYRVVAEYEDNDISASTRTRKPRPSFDAMLADGKAGLFDVVLAYSNSRLTRRLAELLTVIDYHAATGIRFETVVSGSDDLSTADGRMTAQIKGSVDQAESERIGERVRNAAERRAMSGANHGGRRAFGYAGREHEHLGLRLGIDLLPDEANEIRQSAERLLAGQSLRSVVRDLNVREVPTVTGCPWTTVAWRDVMLRPRNAGLVVYRGDVVGGVAGQWTPVYDRDTHERVVALLSDPARRTTPGNRVRWLGSGLYRCGICGETLTCTLAGGKRAPAYRCPGHVQRDADQLDRHVTAALLNRLDQPGFLDTLRRPPDNPDAPDPKTITADIDRMEHRLAELQVALLDDDTDVPVIRAAIRTQQSRIRAREVDLLDARQPSNPLLSLLDDGPTVTDAWVELRLEQQRALLDLLAAVTIEPATHRGRPTGWKPGNGVGYFDPHSIRVEWK